MKGPGLEASRCVRCRAAFHPVRASCEACGSDRLVTESLPSEGALWTWTSQEFPPPSPPYRSAVDREAFVPYFTGYVQVGDLLVLARIATKGGERPRIGARVVLAVDPDDPSVPTFEIAA